MTQDDGIPATVLARGQDTVNLHMPGWGFWLLLGGCAWVLWRGVQRGARGMLGAIDLELDSEWSLFYQSEYQRDAIYPKIDRKMSAAQARAQLLAKYPHALDEPGIEQGSPVAPTRIIKPSLKEQWRMEREGEEAIKQKNRDRVKAWREKNSERAKSVKKTWAATNKERLKAYKKDWREKLKQDPKKLTADRARKAAWRRGKYKTLSPEQRAEMIRAATERVRLRRLTMTPEQREAERVRNRERMARKRAEGKTKK